MNYEIWWPKGILSKKKKLHSKLCISSLSLLNSRFFPLSILRFIRTTFISEFRSITRPDFLAQKSNIFRPDTSLFPRTLFSSLFESFLICSFGFHLLKSIKVRDSVIGFSIAKTRHSTHPSNYSCKNLN